MQSRWLNYELNPDSLAKCFFKSVDENALNIFRIFGNKICDGSRFL